MSAEDETYDIDLYGDEEQPEEDRQTHNDHRDTQVEQISHKDATQSEDIQTHGTKRKSHDDDDVEEQSGHSRKHLKAQKDERHLDQDAQMALKLSDLQWWITEEDVREYCARAHAEEELVELAFGEHKSNGKSKGEAYLEFETLQAAGMVKRELEKANIETDVASKIGSAHGKSRVSVWYTPPGNPFKARDGPVKKDGGGGGSFGNTRYHNSQQLGYNQYSGQNRGGYGGARGRGGFGGRGGNSKGGQWGMQHTSNQNQNHNYSNNNFNNPMMAGFTNMGFGGFNPMAMNQNAMMTSMMGMAGMGMNMQNMMGNRGGGNFANRGGQGGNMNTGSYQQAGFNPGWDNKKTHKEG